MHRAASPRTLILLAFIAFVSLGLPDTLAGIAWPFVRATFDRPISHLGLLMAAGSVGYLVASASGGSIVRVFGVGRLLVGSCALVALALAGYAWAPVWPVMVVCALVGGLGAGAIDAGINVFAAARFSPRIVNWLHACWGIGATLGPLLMTLVIARGLSWRVGYGVVGGVMAAMTLLFVFTLHLWSVRPDPTAAQEPEPHPHATMLQAIARPAVLAQVLLYFIYGGLESTAGAWLFTLFTEHRGVAVAVAGSVVSGYWAGLTVGRVAFGQLAATLSHLAVVRLGVGLALFAAALMWWHPTRSIEFAGSILFGVALAPVFPTIISITPRRVGERYAAHAVGFQVAACAVGIAVFPGLTGVMARGVGLELLPICLFVGTLVLIALHELSVRLAEAPSAVPALSPHPSPA